MTLDGFVPTDWVYIEQQGLDKSSACQVEQEIIRLEKPRYNKPAGKKLLKVTPEIYDLCKALREDNNSYAVISEEVGLSPMTVYRALNNQTKNIGDTYGE
jgi:DNA invertase Pin-like site-specific DNA recombinase